MRRGWCGRLAVVIIITTAQSVRWSFWMRRVTFHWVIAVTDIFQHMHFQHFLVSLLRILNLDFVPDARSPYFSRLDLVTIINIWHNKHLVYFTLKVYIYCSSRKSTIFELKFTFVRTFLQLSYLFCICFLAFLLGSSSSFTFSKALIKIFD